MVAWAYCRRGGTSVVPRGLEGRARLCFGGGIIDGCFAKIDGRAAPGHLEEEGPRATGRVRSVAERPIWLFKPRRSGERRVENCEKRAPYARFGRRRSSGIVLARVVLRTRPLLAEMRPRDVRSTTCRHMLDVCAKEAAVHRCSRACGRSTAAIHAIYRPCRGPTRVRLGSCSGCRPPWFFDGFADDAREVSLRGEGWPRTIGGRAVGDVSRGAMRRWGR